MQIEHVLVKDIIPYANNAKEHPKHQIEQIVRSIREFGFNDPIAIDENNIIIEGHGRLEALKLMDIKTVECIRLSHLTDEQKRAYIIAHNKLTMNTGFNMDIITEELDFLINKDFDATLTGFDTDELTDILHEEKEVVEDDFDITPPEQPKSKLGDLWILGRHRLLCGDSTTDDVDRLMDGKKADMCFTDPPYNVNYQDLAGKHEKIKNDKMEDEFFAQFLLDSLIKIPENSYICCNWQYYHIFYTVLRDLRKPVKSCVVWDKEIRVQNLDKYFKQHEFILYTGKFGGQKTLRGDVFRFKREKNTLHPTMKPIGLVSSFIEDGSYKNDIILDLFGGSGSTLIACEQLNRICYMMELDPKYVDVIVNRYHAFTDDDSIKLIRDGVEYLYTDIMEGE